MANPGTEGLAGSGAAPSLTTIERRGIEHIPHGDRWGKPSGLFWMWAGAVWNVEFVYYGAIGVVFLGLSFAQAVLIIAAREPLLRSDRPGERARAAAGTTTFAISRAPFGPRGNKLPSFFNWITQVGFEIEGIALHRVRRDRADGQGRIHGRDAREDHLHRRWRS